MRLVTFKLPEAYLEAIDWLVKSGRYRSRSDVIRAAVARLVREEHMLIERGLRVSVEEIV
ncbi:hypothetical protein HRbin02_01729 [Candidatus Calditenuaceae archaeon HR02]|nr:hypothetical protein HRbin02_01729 [Candidatus Calditenuaceae archaeon HR02]